MMDRIARSLIKNLTDKNNVFIYPDGPFNPARPIIPTFDTATTEPTDLNKITNGNPDDCCTEAAKTMLAAGVFTNFYFDLGSVLKFNLAAKIAMWSSSGTVRLYLKSAGEDHNYTNVNFGNIITQATGTSRTTNTDYCIHRVINARYLQLQFYVTETSLGHVELYDMVGQRLGA